LRRARHRKIERDAANAARKELAASRSDIGKPKATADKEKDLDPL
jgi:molybdate transport system regulatory protein